MDITNKKVDSTVFKNVFDLTYNIQPTQKKYFFYKILLEKNEKTPIFNLDTNTISIFLYEGEVHIENIKEKIQLSKYSGIHIEKESQFSFSSKCESIIFIASSKKLNFIQNNNKYNSFQYKYLSDYKVSKPWGEEIWLSNNYDHNKLGYALKIIKMKKDKKSSLQSHEFKEETNIVLDGEVLLLYGKMAPESLKSHVKEEDLDKKIYAPLSGWSNNANELHRMIAKSDYATLEISTIELDDVIRWGDDSKRPHGRIEKEHNYR